MLEFILILLAIVLTVGTLLIGRHHLVQDKKRKKRMKALGVIDSFHANEGGKTKTHTNQSDILTGIASGALSEPSFSDGLSHLDSVVQPHQYAKIIIQHSNSPGNSSSSRGSSTPSEDSNDSSDSSGDSGDSGGSSDD